MRILFSKASIIVHFEKFEGLIVHSYDKCASSPVLHTPLLWSWAHRLGVCIAQETRSKRLQVAVRLAVTLEDVFHIKACQSSLMQVGFKVPNKSTENFKTKSSALFIYYHFYLLEESRPSGTKHLLRRLIPFTVPPLPHQCSVPTSPTTTPSPSVFSPHLPNTLHPQNFWTLCLTLVSYHSVSLICLFSFHMP